MVVGTNHTRITLGGYLQEQVTYGKTGPHMGYRMNSLKSKDFPPRAQIKACRASCIAAATCVRYIP